MTIVQSVMLGAVQGITEFLPISSSGHLIIIPKLFGWSADGMTFDVGVHVATLFAIIVALRADLRDLITRLYRGESSPLRIALFIVLATIPAVIAGGLFGDWFDGMRSISVVAYSLIIWGVVLAVADRIASQAKKGKGLYGLTWFQAIVIGVVQVFALIPGTSRSGSTMSAGLLTGLDRDTAARFSFLLAIPEIVGAGLLTTLDVIKTGLDVEMLPLVIGAVTAFVTGLLAIRFLLFVIKRANFLGFALYRVILGVLLLIFLT